ncbi:MAG TPA: trypsin-like peptidase domain-containing protein [Terriglobales bacterium]|nr:trypsin-like peptidase domain-containing protein [Terriglobales bacterium]
MTLRREQFPRALYVVVLCSFALQLVSACAWSQQTPSGQSAKSGGSAPQKPNPITELGKAAGGRPSEAPAILQQLNSALESVVAKVSPAVVQIQVTGFGAVEGSSSHGETALVARQRAIGSGVIVDSDGYIVTNAHVVEGARRIRVILPMPSVDFPQVQPVGKQHVVDAKLIGLHKESDLALIKIDETGLPTLSLGSARRVHQGQLVFAIGSPEGLENSVSMGVVSSVGRQPDPENPMVYIQTDAPINPGNSGGPLVDMDGYVLGINTMILSEGGGSEGLGFAIPARVVRFVYLSLRKHGHVHRVEIKAAMQNITPSLAEGLHLSQSYGVIVCDITPDGPAESAGLKIGDIVISADDRPIDTLSGLTAAMYLHPLDEPLKMVVKRGTETKTLYIPVIESRNPMEKLVDDVDPDKSLVEPLGILAVDLNDQFRSVIGDLRIPDGVLVVARAAELISPETGLKTGDVVHSVNNMPINSVDSFRAMLKEVKPNSPVVLQIERDGGLQWLAFEMD